MSGYEFYQIHIRLTIVAQKRNHQIDHVEHQDCTYDDAKHQCNVHVGLACIKPYEQGRHNRDNNGSLYHIAEQDNQHEDNEYPEQIIFLSDIVEREDQ